MPRYIPHIKGEPSPRPSVERQERMGECYKSEDGNHFYLIRENDILHVNHECINTLFDNMLTDARHNRGEKFIPISRAEFNQKLNEEIFAMNIFAKEFKK